MIEQFHGVKGVYKSRENPTERAEFFYPEALDELETLVIIADPKASFGENIKAYDREKARVDNEKIKIKIAAASTEKTEEFCLKMPFAEVYDGEKGRWMKLIATVK